MLHIIFIILKIIGILLLVILGIILSILLLILFAPFRYSMDGEKGEEICFHARVTWVLFFLRVACSYEKKKLVYYVKVFGYPLVSNEEKKKKAKKKKRKNKKEKKKEKSLSKEEQLLLSEIEEEAKLQAVELEQAKEKKKMSEEAAKDKKTKKEESKEEKSVHLESEMTKEKKQRKEKIQAERKKSESEQKETVSKESEKRWRNPIYIIRNILYKIKDIVCGILEKIRQFVYKLDELKEKINGLLEKAREWMEFIGEEMTKKAVSKLINIIKKLLKHVLPRKIKGNLTFGLEDPAMMGQILAILGMAMPIYKDNLKIQPCFGVNMIQGDIKAKGKIRLAYLLYLAVLVLIDKGIMGTIKKARAMAKGEKESEGGE